MEAYKFVENYRDSIFIGKKYPMNFIKMQLVCLFSKFKKIDQDFIINT